MPSADGAADRAPAVPDPAVVAPTRPPDRRRADRRLAAVVEGMSDAFLSLDAAWRVTYANRECARLNGTTPAALVGCDHWARWPETAGTEVERQYRRAVAEAVPVRFTHHYPQAGVWHAVQAYPAAGGGLAIFYRDVTAERRAEAERERLLAEAQRAQAAAERARAEAEEARGAAEAANLAKAQFLAVMSHELRTPLNAIGGYAELLAMGIRGPVTPEQRSDLERVQRAQRHLLGLINGVLNYSRIEAGAVHYQLEAVVLDEVLAACEALVAPQVRAKGLALAYEGCDPALAVRADREKLQQIVLNLLSNAVKFTGAGGRVEVRCDANAGRDGVDIVVRDTGRGIPADQLPRVFEPFVQVDARLTRTQEGVGLGLAISRDLARGMGGDLVAESLVGEGSTFTLTLPRG